MLNEKNTALTQNYRYRLRLTIESCSLNSVNTDTKQSSEGREGYCAALTY